ncbi:MAG: hypothetical protein A2455_08985 [Ignavibacteria bacterium RIFOXYC2_FULL_35_16]|nr:MAG: hypothetical protein A2X60_11935 [Ignavibacteria bacterium GWF2_35_20]OGU89740.1 MAG: hypothetical protein A2492_14570 [Ignavibacteria bacterium RIFOXYC12_FULL_35_11]OGU91089.1 MAG: hypothetical protein A3K31_16625 [Ignavibacteria bacterium RIFOXYA12_FULL_35_25]OGU96774.1 MAG: hypothetical protein A2347_11025 [Ignavibacteria bacterium RIFOXYB12_FULL_35_14]OGV00015.1 MAG: hypothetical protein A2455_08985 [Ignavibacteria bacterium RIFOXYC2_FULL_35_16]OGV30196.1 MAG: hypothetical protein 
MFSSFLIGILSLSLFAFAFSEIQAQQLDERLYNTAFKDARLIFDKSGEAAIDIQLKKDSGIPVELFFSEYGKAFNLSKDNELKSFQVSKDDLGQTNHRYKQFYKGIELAEVQYILHEKNGQVIHANGKLIHGLEMDVTPTLTENEALQYALANINAESYMWENKKNEAHLKKELNDPSATMFPKGQLMLSAKNFDLKKENFHLVYRFDIYAEKPIDRYYIDVDANTGEIINKISRIRSGDVPGQGTSFYNGVVPLTVADTALSLNPPSRWHVDSWMAYESGASWWVADPSLGNQGGYDNGWYEALDTDPVLLTGTDLKLQFVHRYSVETPGGEPSGYNAWDGMNVRISSDGGNTWQVLLNPTPSYTNTSLYSFGEQHGEGPGIPGWTGVLNSWTNVIFDLSAYTGQTIKIRFAFASDPGLSTNDGAPNLFGWQIDNIVISNSSNTLYSNNGVASGVTLVNLVKEAAFIEGNYRLRQYGRGGGIATYDAKYGTSYFLSTDFVDDDTNFDSNYGKVGVSVHWALEHTYDYFLNVLNRNSFDDNAGKLIAYAHYDSAWFNASWDGSRMRFGDGTSNGTPLVSIDIVSHEMTHGVTDYTANLIYQNEHGALNESFSDVFGTAVEFRALGPSANWFIGEGGARLRSMSNPKQYGQPNTYHGQNWYYGTSDGGGVHTNSGVQNYWYYLLSEGGNGVNDNGYAYSVTGIGLDAASKIAYRNLANYLIPTSEYDDTRLGSMYAAQDLFGENSIQFQSVVDAWDAVGVMKPSLVPTVGIEADTVKFFAEAQFSSDTVDVSIFNYGLQALNISAIDLTGSDFQILSSLSFPINLNYDESVLVKVIFVPTQQGEVLGTLMIASNDPANPNKSLILKGDGFTVHPAQDGQIYALTYQTNSAFLTLNPNNGAGTNIGLTGFTRIYGITVRPSNGQIYTTLVTSGITPLLKVDSETGNAYEVVNLPLANIRAIAFDTNDDLYGASYGGDLYRIDLVNGNLTLIGATGISTLSSLAVNPVDGQLWATPLGGAIYKINKADASATLVGNTGFSQTPSIAFDSEGKFFGTINFASNKISELISIDKLNGTGTVIGSTGFSLVSGIVMKGTVVVGIKENQVHQTPIDYALKQNYPNPFNATTNITYSLPRASKVILKVYDIIGNEILTLVDGEKEAGVYDVVLNEANLPSGVYLYKITAGDFISTKKMILLK